MPPQASRNHIKVEGFSTTEKYKFPTKVIVGFDVKVRDRNSHATKILKDLEAVKIAYDTRRNTVIPENAKIDDVVYVQFSSAWGYELKFDQLHQNKPDAKYQLLSIKKEKHQEQELSRYNVTVMLTKGGIGHFIKKVVLYQNENTKDKSGNLTSKPKGNDLIANIETIYLATLKAFWTDFPEHPFPDENQVCWWEAWFRKTSQLEKENEVIQNLSLYKAEIGASRLEFPDHIVRLVKGTAKQLSKSLLLLDNLSELRKPQEVSNFIASDKVDYSEKREWFEDLIFRTRPKVNQDSVFICLLDSGVNNKIPLINPFLPDERLYSYKEAWGTYDGASGAGHGTGMAGLALFGDLTDAIASVNEIEIFHGLESFKIYNPHTATDPELYGAVTIFACSNSIVSNLNRHKVFCLSVTNKTGDFHGRPSSSSAALDKIAFGNFLSQNSPQLILVSGGNVFINKCSEYPDKNYYQSIQDPGQSYNALTVGSYTRKDRIESTQYRPLAPNGGMAPSNSTSATWETQWPNKPDIVMEGGNLCADGDLSFTHEALSPISVDKEYPNYLFIPFGDTSGAVALASKMAAELRTEYPQFWPETIRGLMVHSADWTSAMLRGKNLSSENDRRSLVRSVGYGVPILEKARFSANNAVTLIAERTIKPFRFEGSVVKYNEYHLFTLPWPDDILRDVIAEKDVKLKVTLSYYIEPNPGNRQYANNFRYHSHDLDFKLIKPLEKVDEFKRRISSASEESENEDEEPIDASSELWTLRERVRSKGSVKKDFITTSGTELSRRNILAVYPKNGWYRTRKALGMVDNTVRYSLILSIETESTEVDLYTSIVNKIQIPIPV